MSQQTQIRVVVLMKRIENEKEKKKKKKKGKWKVCENKKGEERKCIRGGLNCLRSFPKI